MSSGKTAQANVRRTAVALCLSLFLNCLSPLALAQKSKPITTPGVGTKSAPSNVAPQGETTPVAGTPGSVVISASINVAEISTQSSLSSVATKANAAPSAKPEPMAGPDDLGLPSGALNPPPMEAQAPVSVSGEGNNNPLIPSP